MTTPDWDALRRVPFPEWEPRTQLRLRRVRVPRSAVPSVDVHNHLGRWLNDGAWMFERVEDLIAVLDETNVRTVVNLDGFWGEELEANITRYDRVHPGRIATFCWVEWSRLAADDGVDQLLRSLERSAAAGARGVKVWKNLGLGVRDAGGRLILPDDPRVVRILDHAGRLGLPVLIHTADPLAYFAPADLHNERLQELVESPDMWVGDGEHPGFDRLIDALETLIVATPGTRYVAAHVGCAAEDLDRVERMLAAAPNLWIDVAGRISELGRQPRRFARLVERFPDRVTLGTDLYPLTAAKLEQYFHFFESDDEGFDYEPREPYPPHAVSTMSAVGLAPELLERIYARNALAWLEG